MRLLPFAALCLAVGPACTTLPLGLAVTHYIDTDQQVVGVDSDRAGGLWIATARLGRDFYVNDSVSVIHRGVDGTELARFEYNDEFTDVSGLAFSGDAVWLNYNSEGSAGNNRVRKLDPQTGAYLGGFATQVGIVDLDVRDGELLMSSLWNEVVALDLTTGGMVWRASIGGAEDSTQRGIATTDDGKLWVASWMTDLYLLDSDHDVIGSGSLDQLGAGPGNQQLAWDGDQLIVGLDHRIVWVAP